MSEPRWAPPAPADLRRAEPARIFAAGLSQHHVSNTAYPIAHETTLAPYRVPEGGQRAVAVEGFRDVEDLGLYVHVPFCETRCAFCAYTVVEGAAAGESRAYVDGLLGELAAWDDALGLRACRVHGLDLGGGTPTWLPLAELARIVEAVRARARFAPDANLSIETTPRIAAREPDKLAGLARLGVERISMGVQVAEPELLAALGRAGQGVAQQRLAAEHIRAAGFRRFNVDLMYGLAGQSLAGWRATLAHAVSLDPDAITLYRMRYKLTRLRSQAARVSLAEVRELARVAKNLLGEAGYHANPGKTTLSRIPGEAGTSSYLTHRVRGGMPYLGLGLGAQSFTGRTLSYNEGAARKHLGPYLAAVAAGRLPVQDLYDLPRTHAMAKMCAVSFYFGEIDRAAFAARFGVELAAAFPDEIDFLLHRGLMRWTARSLALTALGEANVNGVIALFLAPSVQAHLLALARTVERRARPLPFVAAEAAHV
jgi:oxygen-independent coproporphyrinogen-3 oxidase